MSKIRHQTIGALLALAALTVVTSKASAVDIGFTEVPLDARNSTVRYVESNVGNLVADALVWQATSSGLNPTIGVINGGAIRTNSLLYPSATPATPEVITDSDIFSLLPFGNNVGVIEDVTIPDLLLALENSVSQAAPGDASSITGRFLQVSAGFFFSWEPLAPAGSRIIDVLLDGTLLIDDGAVVSSLLMDIATVNFLAEGGDQYSMFPAYTFLDSGVLYRDALTNFLQSLDGNRITAADYPEGGEGRIVRVPEPATFILMALGLAGIGYRRKQHKAA